MCEGDLRPATLVRLPRDGRTTRHSGFAPAARSVATTRWWPPALAATSASLPPVDYKAPHVAKVREVHDHVADGTYVGVGTVTNKCSNRARMALRGSTQQLVGDRLTAAATFLTPRRHLVRFVRLLVRRSVARTTVEHRCVADTGTLSIITAIDLPPSATAVPEGTWRGSRGSG